MRLQGVFGIACSCSEFQRRRRRSGSVAAASAPALAAAPYSGGRVQFVGKSSPGGVRRWWRRGGRGKRDIAGRCQCDVVGRVLSAGREAA